MSAIAGIDVSSWQHDGDKAIDWAAVHDDGIRFCLVKATQGTDYVNPWLAKDLEGARAAGIIVGAYHYWQVGQDPVTQAQHFTSSLLGQRLELGAWLDWEPGTVPDYQVSGDYSGFVDEVEKARNPCGLYCDQTWHDTFVRLAVPIRRLWLAAPSLDTAPAGAFLWQRQAGAVKGIVGDVDTDVLLSTRGIDLTTAPPPAVVDAEHAVADSEAAEKDISEAEAADKAAEA